MKRRWLFPVSLIAAVWALFARTAAFEFIRLDDHDYTFLCPFVKDGFSWANLGAAFADLTHAAIWMPFTYLTYMLDISWFGAGMGPHHLGNVFIHSLNAVLVFQLVRAVLGRVAGSSRSLRVETAALLAALWWAIHPLRAEPVCWIAGRKELLWTLFSLAGLLCWLVRRRAFDGWTLAAYGCCALACLSKPTAMCFPLLAGCVAAACPPAEGVRRQSLSLRIGAYLPLLAMAAATGLVAVYSQTHAAGYAERSLYTAPLWWRLLNAMVSTGRYLFLSALPLGLHVDRMPLPGRMPDGAVVAGLALLMATCALLLACLRGKRCLPWAGFFLVAVAPVLGVFGSFGREAMADRFVYMPAVGLAVLLGSLLLALTARQCVCFGVYAMLLAVLSWPLIGTWRNDYTLFRHVLTLEPDHSRALYHVASEECARFRNLDLGIEHFRASLALDYSFDTAAQLCYALSRRGGEFDFAEVCRYGSDVARNHALDRKGMMLEALGRAAMHEGRWRDAASCLEDSIKAPRRFYSAEEAKRLLAICRQHL